MQILTESGTFETRSAPATAPWGSTAPPLPTAGYASGAGVSVTAESAMQHVAVWGSAAVISDSIATLPIREWELRLGEAVPVSDARESAVIARPWPEITQRDFITQGTVSQLIRGNIYGRITERDARLYPSQVQLWNPSQVSVKRNRETGQLEFRYGNVLIPNDDVTRSMGMSYPGAVVGLNPIENLRQTIGIALAQDAWNGAYYRNSAEPRGVIQVEGDLDVNETLAMAKSWMAAHQGVGNAHLPAVLTGGAEFKPISMTFADAQFLEMLKLSAAQISGMIYRVPPHMLGVVDRTTSWGCLPGDSLVFTLDGPVPIKDIEVGAEVWSLGESGMVPSKVVAKKMTGHKPLITFHTRGRVVRATPNHHMLVRRWNFPGGGRKGKWEMLLVDAADVVVGDRVVVPHGHAMEHSRDVAPNGRVLTVGAMEFCGIYVGDGSKYGNCIDIAHEQVPDHMEHYKQVVREEFGVPCNRQKRGYSTRFSSKAAVELLETGFTGYALTKRVPGWVFQLRPDLRLAFLRGYLDADGSVQHGAIVFSSANKMLLEDVRHLCIGLGIPAGRVIVGRPAGICQIGTGKAYQSQIKWQLSLSSLMFNSRIGSNSPRKASRFVDTPPKRPLRYEEGYAPKNGGMPSLTEGWTATGCTFHKITKIEHSDLAVPVYDIEVADTHNFVADGVVVGNSGIEEQELGFVRNTLLIWLARWEDLMSSWLPPGQFVTFDLSERLKGDALAAWQGAQIARVIGAKSSAEIRSDFKLPRITDPTQAALLESFDQPLNSSPVKQLQGDGGDKSPKVKEEKP